MSAEAVIVSLLSNDPDVSAAIGNRIAPVAMADKFPRPNIVYQRIDGGDTYSNDGPISNSRAVIQVSCYTDDYESASSLAASVRDLLSGYRGQVEGYQVGAIFIASMFDAPDASPPGASTGPAGVILTVNVVWSE